MYMFCCSFTFTLLLHLSLSLCVCVWCVFALSHFGCVYVHSYGSSVQANWYPQHQLFWVCLMATQKQCNGTTHSLSLPSAEWNKYMYVYIPSCLILTSITLQKASWSCLGQRQGCLSWCVLMHLQFLVQEGPVCERWWPYCGSGGASASVVSSFLWLYGSIKKKREKRLVRLEKILDL